MLVGWQLQQLRPPRSSPGDLPPSAFSQETPRCKMAVSISYSLPIKCCLAKFTQIEPWSLLYHFGIILIILCLVPIASFHYPFFFSHDCIEASGLSIKPIGFSLSLAVFGFISINTLSPVNNKTMIMLANISFFLNWTF